MGKHIFTGDFSHNSDAGFRTWVGNYEAALAACGLVRTADTGQIDPATITRPSNNLTAGYSVWRFNDTLQATAPVFLRFDYGTGASTTMPSLGLTIGQGSNGAGTLTGTVLSMPCRTSSATNAVAMPSYAVHREGLFAIAHMVYANATAGELKPGSFIVQRTVNNVGEPTSEGILVLGQGYDTSNQAARNGNTRCQFLRYSDLTTTGMYTSPMLAIVPGFILDSRISLDPQIYHQWVGTPKQMPVVGSCSYLQQEIGLASQFQIALVGVVPRTYLPVGDIFGITAACRAAGANDRACMAILWED